MLSSQPNRSPFGGIVGIVIAIVAFFVLFKIASIFFWLVWKAAPFVFLASLFIDHKVFVGYANQIFSLFKKNWMYGVVAGGLSIVLFPLVALYLLGMAFFKQKVNKVRQEADIRKNGELIEYEEIDTEPMDLDIPYEELPPPPPPPEPTRRSTNDYDDLFK